ncbi:MAG: YwmB family TATA-box binding protein [Clostridia bacterium]|nr:YwmB family TATA-box binding protein [Clostridia bacterium]
MKRRTGIWIVSAVSVIILFSLYYLKIHGLAGLPETTLQKSFSYSGAKVVSSEIYFWAGIKGEKDNKKSLELLSSELLNELDVVRDDSFTETISSNDMSLKKEAGGLTSDHKVVNIQFQTQKKQDSQSESYISLKVTEDLSSSGLDSIREKALKVFQKNNIEPRINSCITGTFEGKLGYHELNEVCAKVFKEAEAKKVEGMRDDKLISVSAYTPAIEHFIKVNDKKVNLNLAIRYNAYEDKTYIWLATPVITIEY